MAKIQSPSGETEFFQTTELQQAFEKELKTGEKVAVAPGVKEASFLREAPVRAEYLQAFEAFKERILNPYVPPQPSVDRFICLGIVRPLTLDILPSYVTPNGANPISTPYLGFGTVLDLSSGFYNVPQIGPVFLQEFEGIFDGSVYNYTPLPYNNSVNRTAPQTTSLTVPNYYTLTGYSIADWDDPALPIVNIGGINMTAGPSGGGVSYSSGSFTCSNIPNDTIFGTPIFQIQADLYVPAYGDPTPPYGLTGCSYTLFNYSFTNFFP